MKNILIIGFVWPEPTTAAGVRMMQLIKFFQNKEYKIIFVSTASITPYSINLSEYNVVSKNIKLNDTGFDDFLIDLNPNIVVFDRFLSEEQFGWRVAQNLPNAIRILDTEDLHFLRKVREQAAKKGVFKVSTTELKSSDIAKREVASIFRSDVSLIISSYEMQLLQESFQIPNALLLHLPFMMDEIDELVKRNWINFKERQDFICIGNGKHAPNVDAISYLKKEIWPKIRKELPDVNLKIYGAYLPQHILEMHNPSSGFYIMGWAENASEVVKNARVSLAPLRFGAGIKGKLTEAMHCGTPSVTTTIGVEGMHKNLPWAGIIMNDKEDFVAAAVTLYNDEENWEIAQNNGVTIVNTIYSQKLLTTVFSEKLEYLKMNLEVHRSDNFIGSMLLHHTMASTKYLSKWIEAKNK